MILLLSSTALFFSVLAAGCLITDELLIVLLTNILSTPITCLSGTNPSSACPLSKNSIDNCYLTKCSIQETGCLSSKSPFLTHFTLSIGYFLKRISPSSIYLRFTSSLRANDEMNTKISPIAPTTIPYRYLIEQYEKPPLV